MHNAGIPKIIWQINSFKFTDNGVMIMGGGGRRDKWREEINGDEKIFKVNK